MKNYDSAMSGFIDDGIAGSIIRNIIVIIIVAGVLVFYAWSRFTGFKDSGAMEQAQLGRNIAQGRGFTTDCIRPADLWYLKANGKIDGFSSEFNKDGLPDIRHAPLYPAALSLMFRVVDSEPVTKPDEDKGFTSYAPEVMVALPLGIFFSLATCLMVFFLARRCFGPVPALAAAGAYLVSDSVLSLSISGSSLPMAVFLGTAACVSAVVSSGCRAEGRVLRGWAMLLVSAVMTGLAFLTMYSAITILVVIIPFIILEKPSALGNENDEVSWVSESSESSWYGFLAAICYLVLFGLIAMPWLVRNLLVSGGLLGLAPYAALHDTFLFAGDSFDRSLEPVMHNVKIAAALRYKLFTGLYKLYDVELRTLGGGIVPCLFLVSFFKGSGNHSSVSRMRWCILAGLAAAMLMTALGGSDSNALMLFTPLVTAFAAGFLFELVRDSDYLDVGLAAAMCWLMIGLAAIPAVAKVSASRAEHSYPPYYPPHIQWVCSTLEDGQLICTDIPWATAWYGGKTSVYLPESVEDVKGLCSDGVSIGALYLTTRTTDRKYSTELYAENGGSWLALLQGNAPKDFPFTDGVFFPQGTRDQILLREKKEELAQ